MKDKILIHLLGTQGSGKSYVGKKLADKLGYDVVKTDFVETNAYSNLYKGLDDEIRQEAYLHYNLLKVNDAFNSDKNRIVLDFGLFQIVPYMKLFGLKELYDKSKEVSFELLDKFKNEYVNLFYYVFADNDTIESRIKARNRKNIKWELDTFREVKSYFNELIMELEKKGYDVIKYENK